MRSTRFAFVAFGFAHSAIANDTILSSTSPGTWSGGTIVRTGDVDLDGIPDFADASGVLVRWISAANGSVVRSATIGTFQNQHVALADAGDLDGDGVSDLAVGVESVRAFSGATGQVIWSLSSSSFGLGHALARLDDRDGDGRSEILVGVPEMWAFGGGDVIHTGYEGEGRAEVRSGATGALLATIVAPPGAGRGFGGSVCVVDDLDGDGRAELAIAPFYQPSTFAGPFGASGDVRIYSGASLVEIASLPSPPNRSTRVSALGDLDGDGIDELALARIWELVAIFSPGAGATLRTHAPNTLYDRVGQSVASLGDLDGDGVPDYGLGAPQPQQTGAFGLTLDYGPGVVRAHSGATGAPLWTVAGSVPYGRFGWSLVPAGDLDGDLLTDVVVGSPQAGRVDVISSSTTNSVPNPYCVGGLLTGTQRARLSHAGSTSAASNDLVLLANDALPGQSGLFVYSRSAAFSTFGGGWRCIGSPFFRLGPIATVDASGTASYALDLNSPTVSSGPGAIGVGTTAHFQFLFRDLLPGNGGRNASSALAVTFIP